MNLRTGMGRGATAGLQLVKRPVQRVEPMEGLREGSTGRIVVVPRVWAVAEPEAEVVATAAVVAQAKPPVELAFYRKYTEALLRRYLRLSMQSGRVPSLLSKDLFRGHVTRYSVRGFEDVVIFCHDVEQRLSKLNDTDQEIIKRVVLQRYTVEEAASMLGMRRTVFKEKYGSAVDRLTDLLLKVGLLDLKRL